MAAEPHSLRLGPISAAAPGPLYQQIVDGIRREIASGRLSPGAPLPSFRTLAGQLLVSLITVKRAYEDLERAGVIHCHQGLGTFVAERGGDRIRSANREAAQAAIRQAVSAGRDAGYSHQELAAELRREWQRQTNESTI